jgi:hypothetical protein
MDMTVMYVGPMHVSMCYRIVRVEMIVFANKCPIMVRVRVVLIVLVRMGMGDPLMPVEVPMRFTIEEKHPREHDKSRNPVFSRGTLSENQDGKDCADERTRCEPGTGSCDPISLRAWIKKLGSLRS